MRTSIAVVAATIIQSSVIQQHISPIEALLTSGRIKHRAHHNLGFSNTPPPPPSSSLTCSVARAHRSASKLPSSNSDNDTDDSSLSSTNFTTTTTADHFDDVVNGRYACTRFQRSPSSGPSTTPDAAVLQRTVDALALSLRAPTGFNSQPYRAVLVSDPDAKTELAKYCLGRNADRVRDSDCTVVFLADSQVGRDFVRLRELIVRTSSKNLTPFMLRKIQVLILLFSSGYPLPRLLAKPLSWCVRLGVTTVSVLTGRKVLVPSLASAETWSTKNTMLVAMTFLLACTSRDLATSPMEGFNAGGVKKALGVPQRRFKVPLMVSVGTPYTGDGSSADDDDAGMSHGAQGRGKQERFPLEDMACHNSFSTRLSSQHDVAAE